MADLLSKGFCLNIKYMKNSDIKHFVYSLLLSAAGGGYNYMLFVFLFL